MKRTRGLSAQLFGGVLLSMLAAAATFLLFFTFGNFLLDHTVYGSGFASRMEDRTFERLQDYVAQEAITTQKLRRLNAWSASRDNVYLALYMDGRLVLESKMDAGQEADEFSPELENEDQRYTLILADGAEAEVFIYYFADEAFYVWMSAVSGALAFVVFSLCFITLVHHKLCVIQRLKRELDILAGGDLEYAVTVHGDDELGELAAGIDNMRRSILSHQRAEEEIRAANSQLVTAMSHDLRTPLTSLMAYLELLDRDKVKDAEQKKHLIHQSLSKAQSIKDMADKLFEYFLVYTSEWEQPELERMNADEVIGQFWQEYAFALESKGYTVRMTLDPLGRDIVIKTELLQRAFDNLYANLLKYADPSQPIEITCRREGDKMLLRITNAVSSQVNKRQSTNIGLNTCRRILSMHNGSFEAREQAGRFEVRLSLPLSKKTGSPRPFPVDAPAASYGTQEAPMSAAKQSHVKQTKAERV